MEKDKLLKDTGKEAEFRLTPLGTLTLMLGQVKAREVLDKLALHATSYSASGEIPAIIFGGGGEYVSIQSNPPNEKS